MLSFWNKTRTLKDGKAGKLKVESHWDDIRHEMWFYDSARCLMSVPEGFADQVLAAGPDRDNTGLVVPVGSVADEVLRREEKLNYGTHAIVKGDRGELHELKFLDRGEYKLYGTVVHARDVSQELEQLRTFSVLASRNHDVLCGLGNGLPLIGMRFVDKADALTEDDGIPSTLCQLFEVMGALEKGEGGRYVKTDFGRYMIPYMAMHLLEVGPPAASTAKDN